MYEILKDQFKSGKSLTQSKYYSSVKRELWPKFYWDLYPLAQEYYHELNPYFLFNLYRPDLFKFTPVMTVRDGFVPFTNFILNNFQNFAKLDAGLLLVHPDLAPIIPPTLRENFGTWNIVHKKQLTLQTARKVIIFGFVCEQNLGIAEDYRRRFSELKNIHPDTPIELFLPIRKNVLDQNGKESLAIHLVMDALKDILPGRKLKILTTDNFLSITDFKNCYVYDLALDKFYVSDNYLHYYVQSRGATVNNKSLKSAPKDSVFSLDLSFHHELHVSPLPEGKNIFAELLFYKKQNAFIKDYTFDTTLQTMLRELLKKHS